MFHCACRLAAACAWQVPADLDGLQLLPRPASLGPHGRVATLPWSHHPEICFTRWREDAIIAGTYNMASSFFLSSSSFLRNISALRASASAFFFRRISCNTHMYTKAAAPPHCSGNRDQSWFLKDHSLILTRSFSRRSFRACSKASAGLMNSSSWLPPAFSSCR